MTMLKDVLGELVGMFLADARLTVATLAVVAVSAILIRFVGVDPLIGGGVLLASCLLLLVESVRRSSRRTNAR